MARQKKMTQAEAKRRIREAGMRGKYDPEWGWRIAFPDNDEASAYYTDDIEDAVSTAEEMARSRKGNPDSNVIFEGGGFTGYSHPRGMIIKPDEEGQAAAQEVTDLATDDAIWHLLDYWFGNGWMWLPAEQIGALTDAPIMSMDATIEDDGTYTLYPDGAVYWHSNYMVEDPIETWARGDGVVWDVSRSVEANPSTKNPSNAPKPFSKTGQPGLFGWEAKGAYYEIFWPGEHLAANLKYTDIDTRESYSLGQFPLPAQAAEAAVEHAKEHGYFLEKRANPYGNPGTRKLKAKLLR